MGAVTTWELWERPNSTQMAIIPSMSSRLLMAGLAFSPSAQCAFCTHMTPLVACVFCQHTVCILQSHGLFSWGAKGDLRHVLVSIDDIHLFYQYYLEV